MTLIVSLILLAWFIRLLTSASARREQPTATKIDLLEVKRQVIKIHEDVNRLEELENIRTDIECCNGEHVKAVTLSVPTAKGNNSLNVMLDGSNSSTEHITTVVTDEIDSLRTSIVNQVTELYTLICDNGNGNTMLFFHNNRGEGVDE